MERIILSASSTLPTIHIGKEDAMQLNNGYTLRIIAPGQPSPMFCHRGGEIAVDEASKTMYAWGVEVARYGLESIVKACLSYPNR